MIRTLEAHEIRKAGGLFSKLRNDYRSIAPYTHLRSALTRINDDRTSPLKRGIRPIYVMDSLELRAFCQPQEKLQSDFSFSEILNEKHSVYETAEEKQKKQNFLKTYERSVLSYLLLGRLNEPTIVLPPHLYEFERAIQGWSERDSDEDDYLVSFWESLEGRLEWTEAQISNAIRHFVQRVKEGASETEELTKFFSTINPGLTTEYVKGIIDVTIPIRMATKLVQSRSLKLIRHVDQVFSSVGLHSEQAEFVKFYRENKSYISDVASSLEQIYEYGGTVETIHERDFHALSLCHFLNSFCKVRRIDVEFRFVTRSQYLLTLINCIDHGALSISLRHPYFVAASQELKEISTNLIDDSISALDRVVPEIFREKTDFSVTSSDSSDLTISRLAALINGEIQVSLRNEAEEGQSETPATTLLKDFLLGNHDAIREDLKLVTTKYLLSEFSSAVDKFELCFGDLKFILLGPLTLFKHDPLVLRTVSGRFRLSLDFFSEPVVTLLLGSAKSSPGGLNHLVNLGAAREFASNLNDIEQRHSSNPIVVAEIARLRAVICASVGEFKLAAQLSHRGVPSDIRNFFKSKIVKTPSIEHPSNISLTPFAGGTATALESRVTGCTDAGRDTKAILLHSLRENFLVANVAERGEGFEGELYPQGALKEYRRAFRDLDQATICQKAYEISQSYLQSDISRFSDLGEREILRIFKGFEQSQLRKLLDKDGAKALESVYVLQGHINWTRLRLLHRGLGFEQSFRIWKEERLDQSVSNLSPLQRQFIDLTFAGNLMVAETDTSIIRRRTNWIQEWLESLQEAEDLEAISEVVRPFLRYCEYTAARCYQMNLIAVLISIAFPNVAHHLNIRSFHSSRICDLGPVRNVFDWRSELKKTIEVWGFDIRTYDVLSAMTDCLQEGFTKSSREKFLSEIDRFKASVKSEDSFISTVLSQVRLVVVS